MTFQAFSSLMPVRKRHQKIGSHASVLGFSKPDLKLGSSQGSHLTLPQTQGAGSHTCPAGPFPRQRFRPEVNTFPFPTCRHSVIQPALQGAFHAGSQDGPAKETGDRGGAGAEQEAWRQGEGPTPHCRESWLKRQVKMNLPSTSSSSEGEVSCLRLDRMLI